MTNIEKGISIGPSTHRRGPRSGRVQFEYQPLNREEMANLVDLGVRIPDLDLTQNDLPEANQAPGRITLSNGNVHEFPREALNYAQLDPRITALHARSSRSRRPRTTVTRPLAWRPHLG